MWGSQEGETDMSTDRNNGQREDNRETTQRVIETRYQTTRYFLQNQLRTSEAVEDFRTVKSLMDATAYFNVRRSFKFAMETVPVQTDRPKQ